MSNATQEWHFYARAQNSDYAKMRSDENVRYAIVSIPVEITTCAEAIAYAIENRRIGRGTHQSGCFEVSNDIGMWWHKDGNRMDFSTPRKAAKVIYKTWEQMEAEEIAAAEAAA